MIDWLFIGELSTFLATAFLVLIYIVVYRRRPSRSMSYWIIGWALMAARFGFGILSGLVGPSTILTIGYHEATALSSLFMLRAALPDSADSRFRFFGASVFSIASVWIIYSTIFLRNIFWISLPTFWFFGAVQIFNGIIFLRSVREFDSLGTRIAGWSFVVWGMHKLDYPFLRPILSVAPYGYVFGSFLQILVGVGFLMQQFEQAEFQARQLAESLVEKDRRLKESEENHRTLVQGMPDVVLRFDKQYRLTFASANAIVLFDLQSARFIGKSLRELGVADSICSFWENSIKNVIERDLPFEAEKIFESSRREVVYNVRFLPTHDADGSVESIIAIARDVTIQKRSLDHLALEHERLRSLVRILEYQTTEEQPLLDFALAEAVHLTGSQYGYIYRYDEDTQYFNLNSWSGLVMADCRVVDQKSRYALVKTGYWGEVVRRRKEVIVNDFSVPSESHKGYPEGHVAITRFLSVPIFIDEKIVGVVGVANKQADYEQEDANQLKLLLTPVFSWVARQQSVNEAAEKDSLINAMIESMDDPIITLDANGRYTGFFGKWFVNYNVDTNYFIGKNISESLGHPDAEAHLAALRKAQEEGHATYDWTLPGLPPAESPVIQTMLSSIYKDGRRVGFVGIGRDITNMVRTEQRLAGLLEEKTALVQEVQHRVKNNLQIIISLIELQLSAVATSPESGQLRTLQSRIYALAGAFSDIGGGLSAEFVLLSRYLGVLENTFSQLYANSEKVFKILIDSASSIALRIDVAIPVGLIVHEFILNSLHHAVPVVGKLEILVRVFIYDNEYCEIIVSDNGVALDPNRESAGRGGIGFMLAEGLAGQLQGKVSYDASKGFSSKLSFPIEGAGRPKLP